MKSRRLYTSSLVENPISEDVESEENNDTLSYNSSSSTFSFHRKKMSFYLSKFIDKLEPSSLGSRETDKEELKGIVSPEIYSKLNH